MLDCPFVLKGMLIFFPVESVMMTMRFFELRLWLMLMGTFFCAERVWEKDLGLLFLFCCLELYRWVFSFQYLDLL